MKSENTRNYPTEVGANTWATVYHHRIYGLNTSWESMVYLHASQEAAERDLQINVENMTRHYSRFFPTDLTPEISGSKATIFSGEEKVATIEIIQVYGVSSPVETEDIHE